MRTASTALLQCVVFFSRSMLNATKSVSALRSCSQSAPVRPAPVGVAHASPTIPWQSFMVHMGTMKHSTATSGASWASSIRDDATRNASTPAPRPQAREVTNRISLTRRSTEGDLS